MLGLASEALTCSNFDLLIVIGHVRMIGDGLDAVTVMGVSV